MRKISIVQGRLSKRIEGMIQAFPYKSWQEEFKFANKLGYDGIELIYEDTRNPLFTKKYSSKILELSKLYRVELSSISCDYSMHYPLFGKTQKNTIKIIKKIINQCSKLQIPRLGISFEDNSSIKNSTDAKSAIESLKKIMIVAEKKKIFVTLETDLNSANIITLLKKVNSKFLKINFDLGNSCAQGEDTINSIFLLKKYIHSIHIKDRTLLFGQTVKLGSGDVDFKKCFNALKKINFRGYITIQGARSKNDLLIAKKYLYKIKNLIKKYEINEFFKT